MNNSLEALWQYQQAELELEKLIREVKSTPSRQTLNKLHSFLTDKQTTINRIQRDLNERDARISVLSAQLETLLKDYELEQSELDIMENDSECTSAELSEAKHSIEELQGKVTQLSKELNSILEWVEKATEDINDTWSKASNAKRRYNALRAVCATEMENYKPRLDKARSLLDERRKAVSDELMEKYEMIKRNHTMPVARVENSQCSGCNMSLPFLVVKRVALGTQIVECENCGRILISG